ncbi:EAL domain-containing protein [Acidithrix sp. C25]|uniref:EAL domain-containing protein n=1 Tax=Acidithrix sp. C25 TaxID=1671482 RepID=UPI00191BB2AB|nr:EAL domain-containing protein [Acidithrix sp. C25]CAG4931348.1 unnamed protein product [Acidithrix sp. C25]
MQRWTDDQELRQVASDTCEALVVSANFDFAVIYAYDKFRLAFIKVGTSQRGSLGFGIGLFDFMPIQAEGNFLTEWVSEAFPRSNRIINLSEHPNSSKDGQISLLTVPFFDNALSGSLLGVLVAKVDKGSQLQELTKFITYRGVRRLSRYLMDMQRKDHFVRQGHHLEVLGGAIQGVVDAEFAFDSLNKICEQAALGVGADSARIIVADNETHLATIEASYGPLGGVVGRQRSLDEGVAGVVRKTGKPVIIFDLSARRCWPNEVALLDYLHSVQSGSQSVIAVPLMDEFASCIGVIGLLSSNKERFDLFDLDVMTQFSRVISAAILKLRLRKQAMRRERELESLVLMAQKPQEITSPKALASRIVDSLASHGEFGKVEVEVAFDGDHAALKSDFADADSVGPNDNLAPESPSLHESKVISISGPNGSTISISVSPISNRIGPSLHFVENFSKVVASALNGAVQSRVSQELRLQAEREAEVFRSLTQNLQDMVAIVNVCGVVELASPSVGRTLGIPGDQIVGRNLFSMVGADEKIRIGRFFVDFLDNFDSMSDESLELETLTVKVPGRGGSDIHLQLNASPRFDSGRKIDGFYLSATDITHRVELEEMLRQRALRDELTQLANRSVLLDRTKSAIDSQRLKQLTVLIFIDLDGFKAVNDSKGHAYGDLVIIEVSKRLIDLIRPGDVAARIGGDEFVVLLSRIRSVSQATDIAERILAGISAPISIDGADHVITASLGVAFSRDKSVTPADLLRESDLAMYRAKSLGKARVEVFRPASRSDANLLSDLDLVVELRRAVERKEIFLQYQPIYRADTRKIESFEVLARWRHPQRGIIPPDLFIPSAERNHVINLLGWSILGDALQELAKWRSMKLNTTFAINFSPLQFLERDFSFKLNRLLAKFGLLPNDVVVEITEGNLALQSDQFLEKVDGLKRLGFLVALDDFGVGNSTIANLRDLPFDILKIDKSYVQNSDSGSKAAAILPALVEIAKASKLATVAEGVETQAQLERVQALGVDFIQGYFFARPMDPDEALFLAKEDCALKVT